MFVTVLKGSYDVLFAVANPKMTDSVSSNMISFIMNIETQLVLQLYCDCPGMKVRNHDNKEKSLPMVAAWNYKINKYSNNCDTLCIPIPVTLMKGTVTVVWSAP